MPNSGQEKLDQRTNSGMDDSSAMTIEFLRVRLLSERSVSKSARQRADELARRVSELEEQLKIVSLQRRKAEKATVDVLAILENNGISDISEAFDSSSDQDTPHESKVSNNNNSNEEEENSVDSKLRRNESAELSGSDYDFSPLAQRGLAWKGRKGTNRSPEKYKDSYLRRRSSFASTGSSSPRNRVGRSCRQIRRRESKSVVEELKMDAINADPQENGTAIPSEVDSRLEILRGSEAQEEQYLGEGSDSSCLENKKNVTSSNVDLNGLEGDKDMEKALEDQARLIGRYEEMEKAQREWEERFRENNSSTPDSCDPGNQSDVTEEREEIKAQALCLTGTVNSQVQEAKSEVNVSNELCKTQSNIFLPPPHGDSRYLEDQKGSSTPASESLAQDFAPPLSKVKENQESLHPGHLASDSSHNHFHAHGSPGNQLSQVASSDTGKISGRAEVSGSQNEYYALVPLKTSNGFNEVLDALKQARVSLQQRISSSLLAESGSVGKAIEPSLPTTEKLSEIPVGFSGLFRVPTDYAVEATKANFSVSGSQPSSAKYNPITSLGGIAGDKTVSSPFPDTRSSFSADNLLAAGDQVLPRHSTEDRILTSQYSAGQSRISTLKPSFDGNLDAGLPFSRQYSYPAFSSYPDPMARVASSERFSTFTPSRSAELPPNFNFDVSVPLSRSSQYGHPTFSDYQYHDPMPRIPYPEQEGLGFSTFHTRRSVGMPPASHSPFYSDHTRPNMYR